ncbi:unnamed protein product, partial [Closterium sp. NIES-53]
MVSEQLAACSPPLRPTRRPLAARSPPACGPLAAPAARKLPSGSLLAAPCSPLAVRVEIFRGENLAVARESSSSVGVRPLRPSSFMSGLLSRASRGSVPPMPPDPGIEAAALGASESALPSTAPAAALHTFTLDSGASCCFFRGSTTLTPLSALVPVRLADPSGGSVLARSSTVLLCLAVASGSLSGLHLPSFSTNLVSTAALQDAMVTTTTPGGQRVSICTCTRKGCHLATFTRRPGSSLYTLTTEPPQVAPSAQVSASGPVAPPCSCHLLSHQTLLWHHRLGHPSLPRLRGMHSRLLASGLPRSLPPLPPSPAPPYLPYDSERYFLLVVDDYTRYTTVFPLRSKGEAPDVLIPWIRAIRLQLWERFHEDLPVLRLHSDRGAPDWLSHGGRSYLHDPCSCSPFFVAICGPGSRAFVRDTSADKLSSRAIPCVFLGFPPDTPGWQIYHPTSRRVLPSQDVTFDESVPFYCLFPYRTAPLPPPATLPCSRSPSDAGAARGAASGVAASGGVASGGAEPSSAEPGSAEPEGAETRGAEPEGVEPGGAESEGAASGGAEPGGAERGGTEPKGTEPGGAESEGAESGGAEPRGAGATSLGGAGVPAGDGGTGGAGAAGPGGAHTRCTRAAGAGGVGGAQAGDPGAGDTGAGGSGAGGAGAGDLGVGGAGAGGTCAGSARAGAGAVDPGAGDPGAGGAGAWGATSGDNGVGGPMQRRPFFVPPPPSSLPPPDSVVRQVLSLPCSTGLPPSFLNPSPRQSQPQLQPGSPLPVPSPYAEQTDSFTERREPKNHPASPNCTARIGRRVPRPRPLVPGTHVIALPPSSVPLRVPLPPPPESSLPVVPDPWSDLACAASPTVPRLLATVVTVPSFESTAACALVAELVDFAAACRFDYAASLVAESESNCPPSVGGECALGTDVLEDRQEDFECLAAAVPRLVAMVLATEGDPDVPDIPTPRSYAEAITGPYSSQWQTAVDAEMAAWKSTGTYVDAVPTSGANIVDGMWIFRVKRPPGSLPVFKARYVARGFSQRQGVDFFHKFSPTPKMTTLPVLQHVAAQQEYELHSLDFSTAFLQGSLHEEIWLRRPPGFDGSFPAGTQWSLRRPVYGLRQAPCEWHDTLRTTLVTLSFAPSTADQSMFLRTDTSLPPFYVDELVFATADTEALALLKSKLYKRHTCTDLDESVEPSGPYPERVGCRMCLMTLHSTFSILARYLAPGRHRPEHWEAAKRVLRYLCSISGMGLVLGGEGVVVLTGHANASWVDDLATQRSTQCYTFSLGSGSVFWRSSRSSSVLSSSCEAEIYAEVLAVQELRWLTYLLTDLGEQPRLPPNLYQCGQLRLAYVATRANTADIFTKALQSGDHQ